MRTIFFLKDSFILYYDNVIMAAAMLLFVCVVLMLYGSSGGRKRELLFYIPVSLLFSIVCSRLLYWFCHQEQFAGVRSAFQDFFTTGYCMTGVLLGTLLAAALAKLCHVTRKVWRLLDSVGVATCFAFGCIRLSALFNETCRGKIPAPVEAFPLGATITNALGEQEYRFATFMVESGLYFLGFVILLCIFIALYYGKKKAGKRKKRVGNVYRLSLVVTGSIALIMDSTRYDSCFMPFNGFVSLVQILAAVSALVAMILLFARKIRNAGVSAGKIMTLLGFVILVGAVAYTEYLIQRHGDWYKNCYMGMGAACLGMNILAFFMSKSAKTAGEKPLVEVEESEIKQPKELGSTEEKTVTPDTIVIQELD